MNQGLVKFRDFQGIVESVANPSSNSFEQLLNLRVDKKLGGLTNRYGYKTLFDLAYQPDAFAYTRFTGHSYDSLVIASATKIENIENGVTSDLTTAIPDNTVANGSIVNNQVVITLGTSLGSVDPTDYIVYNSDRNSYAVVLGFGPGHVGYDIIISGLPSPDWHTGDNLSFFKNDLLIGISGYTRTITGSPLFQTIDPYNNLILLGEKEDVSQSSLWIGQISNRRYFGPNYDETQNPNGVGFGKNGLYVTRLMEDFTSGAFRLGTHHIEVRVDAAKNTQETLAPVSDYSVVGDWTPTSNLYAQVDEATPDDATYINSHHGSSNVVVFRFGAFTSTLKPNRTGFVTFWVRMKGPDPPYFHLFTLEAIEFVDGLPVSRYSTGNIVITHVGYDWLSYPFQVPVSDFNDLNQLGIRISGGGGGGDGLVSYVSATVDLTQSSEGIDNTGINPEYAVNFSLELDDFQETSLIYTSPYYDLSGVANSTSSYTDSSVAILGKDTTTSYIGVRIYTKLGPLINRRVTGIKVYCGQYVSGVWVWRYCNRIDMADATWQLASDGSYSIEIQLGEEVNTGPIYEDRLGRSSSAVLQKSIVTGIKPGSRMYAVNDVDKQTIYYSQISDNGAETSVIPSSNFIEISDTIGDILLLTSLGTKLIIFKSQSQLSFEAANAPTAPRIQVISRNRGIASVPSFASNGLVGFYVADDGIYVTDGFKEQLINKDWIGYFQATYTTAILQTAIGFYDIFSDSYYVQFTLAADTYDLWAFDGVWRKEEFTLADTQKFGAIKYVTRAMDGRMIFADDIARVTSAYMQLYQFPRSDVLYTNQVRTLSGTLEWNTHCKFKSNPVDDSGGIRDGYFIDGGYIKSSAKVGSSVLYNGVNPVNYPSTPSTQIAGINLDLYDGASLIKSLPTTFGRDEIITHVRNSVSRFALQMEFYPILSFVIQEIGIYFKQTSKSGSLKQNA
jgi:hypothetical protein